MSRIEEMLIKIAESECDNKANRAMKILRERYDKSYFWCADCDFLVTKKENCCNEKL